MIGDAKRAPSIFSVEAGGDPAYRAYLAACHSYLGRQLLVYENWPQRRWTPLGYAPEKVFPDMNA